MADGIKFIGRGHLRFTGFLKKFTPEMKKQVGKATKANLLLARKEIRVNIGRRQFEKNSTLTLLLKGNKPPLVHTKEMIQSIEINQKNEFSGEVGFLENKKTSHSGKMLRVAKILHDGTTVSGAKIRITPKMRAFFFATLRGKGQLKRLKKVSKKSFIHIPGRPFMTKVFEDKRFIAQVNKNWEEAVGFAIRTTSK